MAARLDLAEILKANPHISADELEEARQLLRKLRESGRSRTSHKKLAPIGRRQAYFDEEAAKEAKAVRLGIKRQTR